MKRLCARAVTVLLTVAVGVAAPTAAMAGSDDWVHVPSSGGIGLTGHGYGHGHGMSQYGAEGAARQGRSFRQILSFYYPGTQRHRVKSDIRVLITADTDDDVVVRSAPGLFARDTADDKKFALPHSSAISRWRLSAQTQHPGTTKLQLWRNGAWHRYSLPGRDDFRGTGELRAAGAATLVLPGGGTRVYRGALRAGRLTNGSASRSTVNVLPINKYVKGVVAAEMPASWHQAALRSQSVAART